jgi:hypothetical protein
MIKATSHFTVSSVSLQDKIYCSLWSSIWGVPEKQHNRAVYTIWCKTDKKTGLAHQKDHKNERKSLSIDLSLSPTPACLCSLAHSLHFLESAHSISKGALSKIVISFLLKKWRTVLICIWDVSMLMTFVFVSENFLMIGKQ